MHPKELSIKDYTYDLPEDRIADYPLAERDASRLLIYKEGILKEDIYRHIASHIPADSLLIFNNTKVIAARLLFQKLTGGIIEIFCLEPANQLAITDAMIQQGTVQWQCLVGGASKWKHGQVLTKTITTGEEDVILTAEYISQQSGSFIIQLSWAPASYSFAEVLHFAGAIPLPPYIKRVAEQSDTERYQTIYAQHEGSVAAPTAGLHFTDSIFESMDKKNIHRDFVTLHVGAGTFKPVKSDTMAGHEMHAEYIEVRKETIENLLHHIGKKIVATGTTSFRTLESLYWLGVKLILTREQWAARNQYSPGRRSFAEGGATIDQWEAYDLVAENIPATEALNALLEYMDAYAMERWLAKTQIIVAPGYKPKIVNGLITNFHQPQSTLLLLIAALTGDDWRKMYKYALDNKFRFLSYGDGCLIWI